jgi:hypothetical protein
MFEALKRLVSKRPSPAPQWPAVVEWAKRQQFAFKRVREDDDAFVIDGSLEGKPWRMEWGAPQRHYIEGHELRLRMELGLSPNLQMLLLSQPLFEALERSTFESFTETTQTIIDHDTPEEMRWLVMFPRAPYKAAKTVRQHFHLIGSAPVETAGWVEGALALQLEEADAGFLSTQPPFVLMTLRGRMYLRLQMAEPDVAVLAQAVALFEAAVAQALRVSASGAGGHAEWDHSSSATAWQTQLGPEDVKPRAPQEL